MEIEKNIELLENGVLLTQTEKEIFEMVSSRCGDFNPPVVARAAGGWVRDKLLGKESDDIDIAIENATGLAFAENLKSKIKNDNIKIVVIEANPDQSKHLETARVCIFPDFWIDFCGLRSDSYTQNSRIPIIKQGTPLEDAKRRDFRSALDGIKRVHPKSKIQSDSKLYLLRRIRNDSKWDSRSKKVIKRNK